MVFYFWIFQRKNLVFKVALLSDCEILIFIKFNFVYKLEILKTDNSAKRTESNLTLEIFIFFQSRIQPFLPMISTKSAYHGDDSLTIAQITFPKVHLKALQKLRTVVLIQRTSVLEKHSLGDI